MIFKLLLKNYIEKKFIKNFTKFLFFKSELYFNLKKYYMVDFLSDYGIFNKSKKSIKWIWNLKWFRRNNWFNSKNNKKKKKDFMKIKK